jgi:hypothetical protein
MEPSLDVANTREIRRQLAAAKAALTRLEALLAPMRPDDAPGAPSAARLGGER